MSERNRKRHRFTARVQDADDRSLLIGEINAPGMTVRDQRITRTSTMADIKRGDVIDFSATLQTESEGFTILMRLVRPHLHRVLKPVFCQRVTPD